MSAFPQLGYGYKSNKNHITNENIPTEEAICWWNNTLSDEQKIELYNMKTPLKLSDVRPKLPITINYGMGDISIKNIMDPKWNIKIDWDVYLPSKQMNLQRGLVWTMEQKRELIYSIFKGIKLPPISVIQYKDKDNNVTYKIIDGKQRLTTIISFVKNEFPIIWNNQEYFFDDLDNTIKSEFLYHGTIISNIGYEYYDDLIYDDDIIKWFNLINFAGTPQDKEHMEKLLS